MDHRHVDRWAAIVSGVCALHCLVTPLLIGTLPFLAAGPAVEWGLFGASLALAGVGLSLAWHAHGRARVWVVAGLGLLLWGAGLARILSPLPEAWTSAAGGLMVAAAVLWSSRLMHRH
jgi:hypothetical protein